MMPTYEQQCAERHLDGSSFGPSDVKLVIGANGEALSPVPDRPVTVDYHTYSKGCTGIAPPAQVYWGCVIERS